MITNQLRIILILITILFTFNALAEPAPFPAQMTLNIYHAPSPFKAENKHFLVYEIYLTNYMHSPAKLNSFSIDGADQKNLFTLRDVESSIKSIGESNSSNVPKHDLTPDKKDPSELIFKPAESKIIFVWIPIGDVNKIPKQLNHHLTLASKFKTQEYNFALGNFVENVDETKPVIISSPLKGNYWLAGNAPSNTSDHRRTGLIINGKPFYAQRYAIDFVQIDKKGLTYTGDVHQNTSYHCYNQDVFAVADAEVVAAQDGVPENIPNSDKLAISFNYKDLPGNYIILDLGNGRYAGYAHLIPGSLKVKIGDHVTRHQAIGKLGNSGNSSEPHLHFQITNSKSFLEADGVPYGFDHFFSHASELKTQPSGSLAVKIDDKTFLDNSFTEYFNQLVLENALMNFENNETKKSE